MKAAITGATGFIGAALCREMLGVGHEVTAIIRPGSPKAKDLPSGVEIVELALERLSALKGNYDVFYHMAWNGASGQARDDFYAQQLNIGYTVEAIRAAKRCGCEKFIGAGSQAEYGVVRGRCTEETVLHPFMMYGAAKLSSYHVGKIISAQEKIAFVWPRIYSVYGVGQNSGTLISYVIDALQKGESPRLSPCENMWDFLYITDCAAMLRLLGEEKKAVGVYNISRGKPRVLKEFIQRIAALVNPEILIDYGAKQVNEKEVFWLDPDVRKIGNIAKMPCVGFTEGIQRIINHMK